MLDSARVQALLRRAVVAVIGCLLAVALVTSLVLAGFYLLLHAMTLALTPVLGEAGALAATGAFCLLLAGGIFYILTRPARASSSRSLSSRSQGPADATSSPVSQLRQLIRDHPLESAMTAFALGVVEQSDPRLRALLLEGGMVLMKQGDAEATGSGDEPSAAE